MSYTKAEIYGNAKFPHADVRAIRRRGEAGEHPRDLAQEYRCAPDTIRKIIRRETYSMVPDDGPEVPLATRPMPEFRQEDIEASKARFLALVAAQPPADKPMPSMAESLAAAARESDEVAARVAKDVAARERKEDALLDGLLDSGGIQSTITPAIAGTSTDGGLK